MISATVALHQKILIAVSLFSILFFSAASCMAKNDFSPLFEAAAAELNVPASILRAIARVESNGHPFAMNIAGKPLFLSGKAEAISEAEKALAAGKSFDSGVMQINSQWLSRYSIPLDAVFDAEANIWLGSWILKEEMKRHGQIWSAVARYHSPNPDRGNRYVQKVKAALAKESQNDPGQQTPGGGSDSQQTRAIQGDKRQVMKPSLVKTASDSGQVASSNGFVQRMPKVFKRESAQISPDSTDHFVRRYN